MNKYLLSSKQFFFSFYFFVCVILHFFLRKKKWFLFSFTQYFVFPSFQLSLPQKAKACVYVCMIRWSPCFRHHNTLDTSIHLVLIFLLYFFFFCFLRDFFFVQFLLLYSNKPAQKCSQFAYEQNNITKKKRAREKLLTN